MGMTVVEKILARASGQASVKAGDVLEPRVDLAMSHENAALVINQFLELHKDTGIEPMSFKAPATGTFNICGCKATDDEPYCDGSHNVI